MEVFLVPFLFVWCCCKKYRVSVYVISHSGFYYEFILIIGMESGDIPELLVSSRQNQLIYLTGLDIANNRTHAGVFSAFTVNRERDRPPIEFVMLDGTQTFCKSKVQQRVV